MQQNAIAAGALRSGELTTLPGRFEVFKGAAGRGNAEGK